MALESRTMPFAKTPPISLLLSYPLLSFSLLLLLAAIGWVIYTSLFHSLAGIPGPLPARLTRLWYVREVHKGSFDHVARALHARYGYIVRIAPNEVSISDPEAMSIIYSTKSTKFTKTDFYPPWRGTGFDPSHPDLFTDLDEVRHSARRRLLNNVYSMTSVLEAERYIDLCTEIFLQKLDGFAADGSKSIDLGKWCQMYAFDLIGQLYFGRAFGFLESGTDFGGYIRSLEVLMPVMTTVSVLPASFRAMYMLSALLSRTIRQGLKCFGNIEVEARKLVGERQRLIEDAEGQPGLGELGRRDILAKLFDVHAQKGEKEAFSVESIVQEGYVGLLAGSDTTAIAMRSIIYQLLIHPSALQTLQAELDRAYAEDCLTLPIRYAEAIKLPYFCACVKEGMRVHPSVGLSLPRHVPAGGYEIAGRYFPQGVRVGINAAVLHYETSAFGLDAADFKPERWLDKDRAVKMDRYMLHFGGGARTCSGKNISLAEIHKLLPALFLRYHFELVDPAKPLKTYDLWFNRQEGLDVRVSRR